MKSTNYKQKSTGEKRETVINMGGGAGHHSESSVRAAEYLSFHTYTPGGNYPGSHNGHIPSKYSITNSLPYSPPPTPLAIWWPSRSMETVSPMT
jgi:hypothetical protein